MEPSTYMLKKGTVLYRGDTPFYLDNKNKPEASLSLEKKPTFFASGPDDVAQYGIIYGWVVSDDIELPLLDSHEVMTEIYNGATPDVQKVMEENYGYRLDGFEDRVSIFEKDIIFYQYLCLKGYPGYASHDLEEGQRTSVEIMVCNPTGYNCMGVVYPSEIGDKQLYIDNQVEKYKKRIRDKEEREDNGRKKSRTGNLKGNSLFASPIKGNSLFASPIKGNNLFASPVKGNNLFASPVKGNNLFASPKKGGNKSKRGKSKRGKSKLRKTSRRN